MKNIVEGCTCTNPNPNGIYPESSGKYMVFNNVVTSCDICNQSIATEFFEWKDKDFQKILERSHYAKDDWNKIHILGVCNACLEKSRV